MLADGVHDFAEQVFVGEVGDVAARKAGLVVGFEFLDLVFGDGFEVGRHGFARFELVRIDEDRLRPGGEAVAVDVAEERQLAGDGDG